MIVCQWHISWLSLCKSEKIRVVSLVSSSPSHHCHRVIMVVRNHFFVVIGLRRCYEIFNRNRSLFVHLEPTSNKRRQT